MPVVRQFILKYGNESDVIGIGSTQEFSQVLGRKVGFEATTAKPSIVKFSIATYHIFPIVLQFLVTERLIASVKGQEMVEYVVNDNASNFI